MVFSSWPLAFCLRKYPPSDTEHHVLALQDPGVQHGQTEISVDDARCHQWLTNQIAEAPLHWRVLDHIRTNNYSKTRNQVSTSKVDFFSKAQELRQFFVARQRTTAALKPRSKSATLTHASWHGTSKQVYLPKTIL